LRDSLKLTLSQEKTLITHARTQAARFLGYNIVAHHSRNELGKSGIFWHTEEHERRASNNN